MGTQLDGCPAHCFRLDYLLADEPVGKTTRKNSTQMACKCGSSSFYLTGIVPCGNNTGIARKLLASARAVRWKESWRRCLAF